METRKIQVTGKSTYVISLPKKWVTTIQVKNGDSVGLIPLPDGTMLINPKLKNSEREMARKVLMVDPGDREQLFRKFISVYLAGYNVIEFRTTMPMSKELRQDIRELSHSVIGPQIIEETNNSIVMRDLLDSSDFSMVKGIKRMYLIAKDMHQDAISVLANHNENLADDVESRDQEVDKLFWMISKQYNLIVKDVFFADKMGVAPLEAQGYLLVARSVERIADHAARVAHYAKTVKDKDPTSQRIAAMSVEVIKLLDDAISSFYSNKYEAADEVVNRSKLIGINVERLRTEVLSLNGEASNIVPLAYIVDSLERTRAYTADIAETAINHHFVMEYNNSAALKGVV